MVESRRDCNNEVELGLPKSKALLLPPILSMSDIDQGVYDGCYVETSKAKSTSCSCNQQEEMPFRLVRPKICAQFYDASSEELGTRTCDGSGR